MSQGKKVGKISTVVVAIPGLGDLPGVSRDLDIEGEHAQDVELLLPGGRCTLNCALASRHMQRMGATVRMLANEPWIDAVAATTSSQHHPCTRECMIPGLLDCDNVDVVLDVAEPESAPTDRCPMTLTGDPVE
jgi:hypothetical protein